MDSVDLEQVPHEVAALNRPTGRACTTASLRFAVQPDSLIQWQAPAVLRAPRPPSPSPARDERTVAWHVPPQGLDSVAAHALQAAARVQILPSGPSNHCPS